jgi:hypothetical protein
VSLLVGAPGKRGLRLTGEELREAVLGEELYVGRAGARVDGDLAEPHELGQAAEVREVVGADEHRQHGAGEEALLPVEGEADAGELGDAHRDRGEPGHGEPGKGDRGARS